MSRKKFVLSSTNHAKRAAVEKVLMQLYGDAFTLECIDVESGVSETPHTDDEGIKGAIGRIDSAMRQRPGEDGYIGLEGIVTTNSYGTFLCGWAVVRMQNESLYMGCSAKVQLPSVITNDLSSFKKLSELTAELYPGRAKELPRIGTNGVLTNGLYTRVDEFADALKCAFGTLAITSE